MKLLQTNMVGLSEDVKADSIKELYGHFFVDMPTGENLCHVYWSAQIEEVDESVLFDVRISTYGNQNGWCVEKHTPVYVPVTANAKNVYGMIVMNVRAIFFDLFTDAMNKQEVTCYTLPKPFNEMKDEE
jgi:hypothetical protein